MDHRPQAWGRPRDDVYGAYDHSFMNTNSHANQHTQQPLVTGTSVLAVKYKDGVVIAADNLGSYGSFARFTDVKRLHTFQDTSVVGFSGDISDMQYITRHLHQKSIEESYASSSANRKSRLSAANLHTYLSKMLYRRRSKMDPLWNHMLVVGFDDDEKPFVGSADLLGTTFTAPTLATGIGSMLAQPLLRTYAGTDEEAAERTKEEAIKVIQECMKVLFYRDARSQETYSLAVVSREGVEMKTSEKLENMSWAFADRIKGYGTQTV